MGRFIQITGGSITGGLGAGGAVVRIALIERRLVHFIASDMHDSRRRPSMLDEACAALEERFGEAGVRPLFVGYPRAVVEGEQIEVDAPPAAPSRRWRLW